MSDQLKHEFVFGQYIPRGPTKNDDTVVIKENVHHPDGSITPKLRVLTNPKIPLYITKPQYRNHKTKKEFERLEKVDKITTTYKDAGRQVFYHLYGYPPKDYVSYYDMKNSPYLYGGDMTPSKYYKNLYRIKYPNLYTPSTLAVMDYETDVVDNTQEIICGAITYKEKACIAYLERFIDITPEELKSRIQETLTPIIGDRLKEIHCIPVKSSLEVTIELYNKAHEWKPDFLGFWNMEFDMDKTVEVCSKNNYPIEELMRDPKLPKYLSYFKYIKAKSFKTKQDGSRTPRPPYERWHTIICPSSFYHIDNMALYRFIRLNNPKETSYSLDHILNKELNLGKLRLVDIPDIGFAWHRKMQTKYPVEYLIYNIFDCISVELLDEKTHDVSHTLRTMVEESDISSFDSNPTRLADSIYYEALENGYVIGTTGSEMRTKLDDLTPSIKGWIVTLSPEKTYGLGLPLLKEYPNKRTYISYHNADLDVASAYPTGEEVLNISQTLTMMEGCKFSNKDDNFYRHVGVSLTGISSNAYIIARKTMGLNHMDKYLEDFKKHLRDIHQ